MILETKIDTQTNEASSLSLAPGFSDRTTLSLWTVGDEDLSEAGGMLSAQLGNRNARFADWAHTRLNLATRWLEDAESIVEYDGTVYIFGSFFTQRTPRGRRTRSFVASFEASSLDLLHQRSRPHLLATQLKLRRDDSGAEFRHQILDALPTRLWPITPKIAEMIESSDAEDTSRPVNLEGAAFSASGAILLGLRYPISSDGHPFVLKMEGLDPYLDGGEPPSVTEVHEVRGLGSPEFPMGIRDLCISSGHLHILAGGVDKEARGANAGKAGPVHCRILMSGSLGAQTLDILSRIEHDVADYDDDDGPFEGLAVYSGQDGEVAIYVRDSTESVEIWSSPLQK